MGVSKKQVQKMFLFSFSSSRSLFFATAAAAATPVAKDRGNETGSLSLPFLSLSLTVCARAFKISPNKKAWRRRINRVGVGKEK